MKKLMIGIVVIVVVAIAAVSVLVATGRLYVGLKEPSTKIIAKAVVCGGDDITVFNKASMAGDQAAMKSVVAAIEAKKGYAQDPTCVHMQAQFYANTANVQKLREVYATVQSYDYDVTYIRAGLNGVLNREQLKAIIDQLTDPSTQRPIGVG